MSEPQPDVGQAGRAVGRAAKNTAVRAAAELGGKFASLALFAVLAREQGPSGLGVFLFALAWCELSLTPVDMGFDRYFLRRVAADGGALERLFANVVVLKLARAVPVVAASWLLVLLTGQDDTTRAAIFLLTAGLLFESLAYTVTSAFNAFERGGLVAAALLTQRLLAAGLGITVLLAGHGVVAVATTYATGAGVGLAVSLWLLATRIRWPGAALSAGERRGLRTASFAYATQDLFAVGIARVDAVMLAALAGKAVVGIYGAAYRMLEATLVISNALTGAFSAMFTYLNERTDPPIRAVFERAIKATLALLVPCGVALAVLAEPVLRAFFGDGFEEGAPALRVLAAVVVVLGIVRITGSLVVSRGDPRTMSRLFGIALALNIALNVLLIPPLEATGAALAMLATELLIAAGALRLAARAVSRLGLRATAVAPLAAGAAMTAATWPVRDELLAGVTAGVAAYVVVFVAVERLVNPDDFRFLVRLARARLPSRTAT